MKLKKNLKMVALLAASTALVKILIDDKKNKELTEKNYIDSDKI